VPRKILGVIPARFASSRFPGKVLAQIASKSMLQHVYERASLARYLTATIIATDDERVYEVARSFGARGGMTRADHLSGTDRVAEAASAENAELVVNIQGDEPLIDPAAIDAAILPAGARPRNRHGHAEEGHRGPARGYRPQRGEGGDGPQRRRHLLFALSDSVSSADGVRRRRGLAFQTHRPLRVPAGFSAGVFGAAGGAAGTGRTAGAIARARERVSIRVVETEYESLGVDTPEDLERVCKLFEASMAQGVRQYG
jgi:3-deoxy-manno-octulosonate cytidylyltransferase (CMP-KDO synthetase)